MYSNYGTMPSFPQASNNSYSSNPVMASNTVGPYANGQMVSSNDDRFIGGGFLGPFVLGGITGGLLAPAFYPRPYYNNYYPYPYYGPYYR